MKREKQPYQNQPKSQKGALLGLCLGAVAVTVAAVIVAVVTGGSGGAGSASAPAPTTVQRPSPPVEPAPPDRDHAALIGALRAIDACKLLDVDRAREQNPKATTIPTGPHACMLVGDSGWHPSYPNKLAVAVGAEEDAVYRFWQRPLTIGGAKAYEMRRDTGSSKECSVDLPVSYLFSIRLELKASSVRDPRNDSCAVVERFAETAVRRLSNPDSLAVDPATRPFVVWDGCSFLAKLLGSEAARYRLTVEGHNDPFSGCTANTAQLSQRGPSLTVEYDDLSAGATDRPARIGGKDVLVSAYGNCQIRWIQGDSGNANKWFKSVVFTLTADDCPTAERLAAQAMTLANGAPDGDAVKPQRPLLYGPDENDTGKVGACVDLALTDCVPYRGGVTVPSTFAAAAAAAARDKAVHCAAFQDAVKAAYGDALAPVMWAAHCVFVEPTHELEVWVNVDGTNVPGAYGLGGSWVEREIVRIEGKQAVVFWTDDHEAYDVYYSPYDDLTRPGNLHIQVKAGSPRGVDSTAAPVLLDPAKADLARGVIAQVARTFFP